MLRTENIIKRLLLSMFMMIITAHMTGCSTATEPEAANEDGSEETWKLIREAYIYAFPLVLLDATAQTSTNTEQATRQKAPINQLVHVGQLANADSKIIVTPNADTVYSTAHLDLSGDAMVFYKPEADRFLFVEMMDAYTNCVAVMGTGADTQNAREYLITGPEFSGDVPVGLTQVKMPTNNVWMLVRTVVNDEADLPNVYALQEGMRLLPLRYYLDGEAEYIPEKGTYSPENDFIPIQHVLEMTPQEFFTKANQLMEPNPPTAEDAPLMTRLANISVGAGLDFDLSVLGDDAEQSWRDMINGMRELLTKESSPFLKKMGMWSFWGEPIAEFGTEYAYRAMIALGGLGANPVSIAIYPRADTDASGAALNGENQYRIRFEAGKLPPTREYGFWSITAYGQDDFLIDNELNRYLINDRSNVVYNDDGSLDILLSARPPEDEGMMGNWLPVKAEQFHLHARIYLPDDRVFNGEWELPAIEQISGL